MKLWACIAVLVTLIMTAGVASSAAGSPAPSSRPLVNERCPVTIEEFATPSHEVRWEGYSVRFCCEKCERRFESDPASYVTNLPQLPPELVEKTILDAQGDSRQAQAASRIERWTRPVLLTLAGLILLWLVARVSRRHVGPPPAATS